MFLFQGSGVILVPEVPAEHFFSERFSQATKFFSGNFFLPPPAPKGELCGLEFVLVSGYLYLAKSSF